MSSFIRGINNVLRTPSRSIIVVVLLTAILTSFALLASVSIASANELRDLETKTRTLIELREAGAFGTGGFGGDKPIGEHEFTFNTLQKALQIPSKNHIVRADEYVYVTDINTMFPNAFAMIIGMQPNAEMRAVGEIDYEAARIIAGRKFNPDDKKKRVAIVGRAYAEQRTIYSPKELIGKTIEIKGVPFNVIGIYDTGNEFANNQVFAPIDVIRDSFNTGDKLSKIFIVVDSVHNVDLIAKELSSIKEADVVTTPNAVRTAKRSLSGIALSTRYGAVVLFISGALLLTLIIVMSTREKTRELGILKAIGGSYWNIIPQVLGEALALSIPAALLAALLTYLAAPAFYKFLEIELQLPVSYIFMLGISAIVLVVVSNFYPLYTIRKLSPLAAVRKWY